MTMSGKRSSALALAALLTSGCTMNSTVPLATGGAPHAGRAVIVYGVGVDGPWAYPNFSVQLTEYSIDKQAITGNCFRFNRVDAIVPATAIGIRYFAFDVAPGSYVYSPMNGAQPKGEPVAFRVPAGRAVYLGDFVYGKDGRVTRGGNLDGEKSAIRQALPAVPDDVMIADTVVVAAPKPFLCAP
jgi:hypothetical protein